MIKKLFIFAILVAICVSQADVKVSFEGMFKDFNCPTGILPQTQGAPQTQGNVAGAKRRSFVPRNQQQCEPSSCIWCGGNCPCACDCTRDGACDVPIRSTEYVAMLHNGDRTVAFKMKLYRKDNDTVAKGFVSCAESSSEQVTFEINKLGTATPFHSFVFPQLQGGFTIFPETVVPRDTVITLASTNGLMAEATINGARFTGPLAVYSLEKDSVIELNPDDSEVFVTESCTAVNMDGAKFLCDSLESSFVEYFPDSTCPAGQTKAVCVKGKNKNAKFTTCGSKTAGNAVCSQMFPGAAVNTFESTDGCLNNLPAKSYKYLCIEQASS